MILLLGIAVMLLLAVGGGLLLAFSARRFRVPKDERRLALLAAMPGINCGACGFPSCDAYAAALSQGKTENLALCLPGGNAVAKTLGEIVGRAAGEVEAEVAFVKCQGSPDYAKDDFLYRGLEDCNAAALLYKGSKSCEYGCIGLGSCIKQCPVDAIRISADSLAVVDPQLCIGCRKCIPVCPTGVIQMIPQRAEYAVICNARDHGKVTRSNCKVGCIGCRVCERKYPALQFRVRENLAAVDYAALKKQGAPPDASTFVPDLADIIQKCPPKCIVPLGSGISKIAELEAPKNANDENTTENRRTTRNKD